MLLCMAHCSLVNDITAAAYTDDTSTGTPKGARTRNMHHITQAAYDTCYCVKPCADSA